VQRIGDGHTGQVLGGGQVTLCAVYIMHVEMRSTGFLVEPQMQGQQFVSCLASKPLGRFSPVWPQNRWQWFLRFGLKTGGVGFLVEPQNQGGGGFPGLGLMRYRSRRGRC
jgi:hypothetical protein